MLRRILILLLMLLFVDSACFGLVGRALRTTGNSGKIYAISTFETSKDGWVSSTYNASADLTNGLAHTGLYSYYLSAGSSGYGSCSITRTFNCASGKLTFWSARNNTFNVGRVLIDGVPVWGYTGVDPHIWTEVSIDITAGSHVIKFEIPNTSTYVIWNIDDISVPVP